MSLWKKTQQNIKSSIFFLPVACSSTREILISIVLPTRFSELLAFPDTEAVMPAGRVTRRMWFWKNLSKLYSSNADNADDASPGFKRASRSDSFIFGPTSRLFRTIEIISPIKLKPGKLKNTINSHKNRSI